MSDTISRQEFWGLSPMMQSEIVARYLDSIDMLEEAARVRAPYDRSPIRTPTASEEITPEIRKAAGCGRSVWVDLNSEGRLSVRGVKLTEAESQTARTLFYELHERQADPYALDRVIEVILASRILVRSSAIEVIDGKEEA